MKYAVEKGSGVMVYIPISIQLQVVKSWWGGGAAEETQKRHTACDLINLFLFFENKENGLKRRTGRRTEYKEENQ
jgi:hypothetical protein